MAPICSSLSTAIFKTRAILKLTVIIGGICMSQYMFSKPMEGEWEGQVDSLPEWMVGNV